MLSGEAMIGVRQDIQSSACPDREGQAEVAVMDAGAYQHLTDRAETMVGAHSDGLCRH
jgi:hypothetical protein